MFTPLFALLFTHIIQLSEPKSHARRSSLQKTIIEIIYLQHSQILEASSFFYRIHQKNNICSININYNTQTSLMTNI